MNKSSDWTMHYLIAGLIALMIMGVSYFQIIDKRADVKLAEIGLEECKKMPGINNNTSTIWVRDCEKYIRTMMDKR